nr:hypothetical protein MACL_00000223 [Theileria orientalis]
MTSDPAGIVTLKVLLRVFWLCNSRDVNIFKILTRVRSKCPILGRFPEAKRSGSMLNAFKPSKPQTFKYLKLLFVLAVLMIYETGVR